MVFDEQPDRPPKAIPPPPKQRLPLRLVRSPHPSVLDAEKLLEACELRTQRRSGPGGQHRNKTSSGVFLQHQPTGVVAEATERRSQAQNRSVALTRLRLRLAVEVRTASLSDAAACPVEEAVRQRYRGTRLRFAASNTDRPAIMALLLNDIWSAGGQPSLVSAEWGTTTGAVVTLLKSERPAWELVNLIRSHHDRMPLK